MPFYAAILIIDKGNSMLETLLGYYNYLMQLTSSNPIFGSAVFVSVFGSLFVVLKDRLLTIPLVLWGGVLRLIRCTFYLRTEEGWGDYQNRQYDAFLYWYSGTKMCQTFVRNYQLGQQYIDGRKLTMRQPGLGTHFFIWKNRLGYFVVNREVTDANSYRILSVIYFGPNDWLEDLRQHSVSLMEDHHSRDRISVYVPATKEGTNWSLLSRIRTRRLESVIVHSTTQQEIVDVITKFKSDEQWYLDKGIPYKLIIILEGPPGTGKTSLIRAIASHFNAALYKANMSQLANCVGSVDDEAIVYVEDFDSDAGTASRTAPDGTDLQQSKGVTVAELMGTDLSEILNAMDGMLTPHGLVMIFTTNHLEKIDAAVYRDERVDHIFHIGLLDHDDICRYIKTHYGSSVTVMGLKFKSVPGSTLQKLLKRHPDDVNAFIADLQGQYQDNVKSIHRR